MTGTIGHDGFGGLSSAVGRLGRFLGWAVFACMLVFAVTVALVTTLVVGAVLLLAAVLLTVGRSRRPRPSSGDGHTLEARSTPDGGVIEPSSSAR